MLASVPLLILLDVAQAEVGGEIDDAQAVVQWKGRDDVLGGGVGQAAEDDVGAVGPLVHVGGLLQDGEVGGELAVGELRVDLPDCLAGGTLRCEGGDVGAGVLGENTEELRTCVT